MTARLHPCRGGSRTTRFQRPSPAKAGSACSTCAWTMRPAAHPFSRRLIVPSAAAAGFVSIPTTSRAAFGQRHRERSCAAVQLQDPLRADERRLLQHQRGQATGRQAAHLERTPSPQCETAGRPPAHGAPRCRPNPPGVAPAAGPLRAGQPRAAPGPRPAACGTRGEGPPDPAPERTARGASRRSPCPARPMPRGAAGTAKRRTDASCDAWRAAARSGADPAADSGRCPPHGSSRAGGIRCRAARRRSP